MTITIPLAVFWFGLGFLSGAGLMVALSVWLAARAKARKREIAASLTKLKELASAIGEDIAHLEQKEAGAPPRPDVTPGPRKVKLGDVRLPPPGPNLGAEP